MAQHVFTVTPGDMRQVEGTCGTCQFDALAEFTFYTLRDDGPHVFAHWSGCTRCTEA